MDPQRPKLVDQIVSELYGGIESRRWSGWLPQERNLAAELKVSRSTLRLALSRLRSNGLLETVHSKGNRILPTNLSARRERDRPRTVNLIAPGSGRHLPPSSLVWIESLRAQLAGKGVLFRVITSDAAYGNSPEKALEEVVGRNKADCWLVRSPTPACQQWLERRCIPAVILGTPELGVSIPYIDINHRALIQHAVGLMVAAGHRRIAFWTNRNATACDAESERRFIEATNPALRHSDLRPAIVRFGGGAAGIARSLLEMLRTPYRPTVIFVPHSIYCLTIWSYLGAMGLRVPHDLSVVAHVGTADLSYLLPEPAHYRLNTATFVQKIVRTVLAQIEGGLVPAATTILPEFVRGASLARAATTEFPAPPASTAIANRCESCAEAVA